ncbi:MAG: YlmH/Sll1252 family protein [Bacillota bacterium]|nr:YlmH/Sll1252 family protein [Bacillota bacterium]
MPLTDKTAFLKAAASEDEKFLLAKAYDLLYSSEKTGDAMYLGFETPVFCKKLEKLSCKEKDISVVSFGGYSEAERKVAGFIPVCDTPDFPISVVEVTGRSDTLTHRDYLGSILGLGITRENVGDICIEDGRSYVFCLSSMADFIAMNLTAVKKESVSCKVLPCQNINITSNFEFFKGTVPSERADAVLSVMFKISRSDALEAIKASRVHVNYEELKDPSKKLKEKDVVSLRGFGKAVLEEFGGFSRKDRLFITVKKFL